MNNAQRKELKMLKDQISYLKNLPMKGKQVGEVVFNAKMMLETMVFDEEGKIDNLPDNLYFSGLADRLMVSLGKLEDAKTAVECIECGKGKEEYLTSIDEAVMNIEAAIY